MIEHTESEIVYMTHCCLCGYRLGKSTPGSKVYLTCPKCGSELEIQVDEGVLHIFLLRTKKERKMGMTI